MSVTLQDLLLFLAKNNKSENIKYIFFNRLELELDNVIIKECSKGLGVFANRNILKNELITLYPVDTYEDDTIKSSHFKQHMYRISNSIIISGDNSKYSPSYCGHICNDGAMPKDSQESIDLYEKISILKTNANIIILNESVIAVIATKDININNEVLLNYGISRWKMIQS